MYTHTKPAGSLVTALAGALVLALSPIPAMSATQASPLQLEISESGSIVSLEGLVRGTPRLEGSTASVPSHGPGAEESSVSHRKAGALAGPDGATVHLPGAGTVRSTGVSSDQAGSEANDQDFVVPLTYAGLDFHEVACLYGTEGFQDSCYEQLKDAIFELVACVTVYAGWLKWALGALSATNPVGALTAVGIVSGYLVSVGLCTMALDSLISAIEYCLGPDSGAQASQALERKFDGRWGLHSLQESGSPLAVL